jgi:2-polyprenyl-3-methyl-5-hydroxy-6-metoxy-1,4-benzoquinol methylase
MNPKNADKNTAEIESSIKKCYSTWGTTYYEEYYGPNAPYPPVHRDLLKRLIQEWAPRNLLDAGCGPASFLREIFSQKIDLYGFDLTPEMVQEGKRIFAANDRDPAKLWQGSVLDKSHFRNPEGNSPANYDATVCMGVLPHIPAETDSLVLTNLNAALNPGGYAIVEARNQLFSLFTMNRYSYEFFVDQLVKPEEMKAKLAPDQASELTESLEEMKRQFRMDLPPVRKGKKDEPGYDEVLSRTHNPFELRSQFSKAGFKNIRTLFYHFHALPPMFGQKTKSFFLKESLAMENDPEDWRGHFMASAFLLVGEKA